jgi:hypothetical protein
LYAGFFGRIKMNAKTSRFVAALCFTVMLSAGVLSQTFDSRPRRASATPPTINYPQGGAPSERSVNTPLSGTLEAIVPREGLLLYFEIGKGRLVEMAQSVNSLAPLMKSLTSKAGASQMDMAGFFMSQMGVLANARIAAVSFGAREMAAVIETANAQDAESLKAALGRLLGDAQARRRAELEIRSKDRIVMAGNRAALDRLSEAGAYSIGEDQQFMHARSRFADDTFFAYIDMSAMPMPVPNPAGAESQTDYMAGFMTRMSLRPQAFAVGGRLNGDQVSLRALMLYGPQQSGGLFGRMFSSEVAGENRAASFASPSADVFVDLRINWDGLLDGLNSIFDSIASAVANQAASESGQQAMAMPGFLEVIESSLGFSIRHDLIPTLGNEVAFSISGFSRMLKGMAAGKSQASRPAMPNFTLMVELRDPARFESLLLRLFNPPGKPAAPLASESYRGSVIKWNKSVAYSISGGYLVLSGSPVDVRRALDARATGNSLAASAQFRAAVGSSSHSVAQGYISSRVSGELFSSIVKAVGRSNREMAGLMAASSQSNSALGFSAAPDPDGFMMEFRLPTNLALLALASMSADAPAAPTAVMVASPTKGVGIPQSTERRRGRKSPTLTTEDVKARRK